MTIKVSEPIVVVKGDFIVYTTESQFVLIKVYDLITGAAPILSLKARKGHQLD